ncbi:MAG: hypothetical protein HUU54_05610 [Ignavibacteriaceae bacterium]|nr:hypothetical protein [Ignavibacteriaceae bacterium]
MEDATPELNENEIKQIIKEMTEAWSMNMDYIVSDGDIYGNYVLYYMYRVIKAHRISSGTQQIIVEGKEAMTDIFELNNGKRVRIGYFL